MNMNSLNSPPLVGRNLLKEDFKVEVKRFVPDSIQYDDFDQSNEVFERENAIASVKEKQTKDILPKIQQESENVEAFGMLSPRKFYTYKKPQIDDDEGDLQSTKMDIVALIEAFLGWLRFMVASAKKFPNDCLKRILCEMNSEITRRLQNTESAVKLAEIATISILQNQNYTNPGKK